MDYNYATNSTSNDLPTGHFWTRNKVLLALLLVVAVVAGVYGFGGGSNAPAKAASASAIVDITPQGFVPATISIHTGQSVEWVNEDDSPHQPATDPYPLENGLAGFVDSTPLLNGDSYSFTFTNSGTFTYHDHLNPYKFKGTVIVQ